MLLNQLRGQVNIKVMRAFTKMRQMIFDNEELRKEIENLRADVDGKFQVVFEKIWNMWNGPGSISYFQD